MWVFIRRVPIARIALRPFLIPRKHLVKEPFSAQMERAFRIAAARSAGLDCDADADAHKFLACVYWVIFGSHLPRTSGALAAKPWIEVVTNRVDQLYRGDFETIFEEAAWAAENPSPRGRFNGDKAQRAVDLAHLGNVSNSLGALSSGGGLPL